MTRHHSLARFLVLPENHSAHVAVQDLAAALASGKPIQEPSLLFLHGLSGVGKTQLAQGLANAVTLKQPGPSVTIIGGGDFRLPPRMTNQANNEAFAIQTFLDAAGRDDLLIIEDLQQLPSAAAETVIHLLDQRWAHRQATLITAQTGPRHIASRGERFPNRLTTRLAAGLVVELAPLQPPSRLLLLQEFAQRRQLAVSPVILRWLADHLGGGARQLEGAIEQLIALNRLRHPLELSAVEDHFRVQAEASKPTLERIAREVCGYYHVEPRKMRSLDRARNILWPRQVGMYLARRLTSMTLDHIGAYFGGRDHTTVLHACRKVKQAVEDDPGVAGVVLHLHAKLT